MSHEHMEILRETPLFKHLSDEKLHELSTQTQVENYSEGDIIVKEGDIGDRLYIIIHGNVRVFTHNKNGEEVVLARLEKGNFFGEQALLTTKPLRRNASIRANTAVKTLTLSHEIFQHQLQASSELLKLLKQEGEAQLVIKLEKQLQDRNRNELGLLSLFSHSEHYAEQQVFFRQGDQPDNAYYLLSGSVEIRFYDDHGNLEVRSRVNPGQFFGELGILENSPRAGTAIAISDSVVFIISAKTLKEAYQCNPGLRALMNDIIRIYKIPSVGLMTQYQGSFLNQPAVQTTIRRSNGDTLIASRVIDTNIFSISYADTKNAKTFSFEDTPDHLREIMLLDNYLVGVVSVGQWDDLDEVCRQLYEKPQMNNENLKQFCQTGKLSISTKLFNTAKDNICECMQVKLQEIHNLVAKGITNLVDISKKTGAGAVCGGCRPRILELLGSDTWTYVKIFAIKKHNEHVCSFQLQPLTKNVVPYFAGQHIVIEADIDNHWVARTYTLTSSDTEKNYYEITVNREPLGLFSRWLFDHAKIGLILRMAEPQGSFIFYPEKLKPALCFMGGIGITPAIAFTRKLIANHMQRILHIDYSIEHIDDMTFREEIMKWPQDYPNVSTHVRVTSERGQITPDEVHKLVTEYPGADFFICGPAAFEESILQMLKNVNVDEERIHLEKFTYAGGPPDLIF